MTSPYSFVWSEVPEGMYSLTAKATNAEATGTSSPVEVTVTGGWTASGKQLIPGVYVVKMNAGNVLLSRRLLVK